MTVAELLTRMSAREFAEWQVFYNVVPFGEERADLRAARIAAATINAIAGQAAYTTSDFLFDTRPVQSTSHKRAILKGLATAMQASGRQAKQTSRRKARSVDEVRHG